MEALIVAIHTPKGWDGNYTHMHKHTLGVKGRVGQRRSENFWEREGVEVEKTGLSGLQVQRA